MAVLITKELSYIFNSDTTTGAINVSPDGSVFSVALNNPIVIPKQAVYADGGVAQAAIWNTSPNIAAAFGNNNFTFTTTAVPAGTYSFTIPDGLYSVDGLNAYLSSQFVNLGLPSNLITIGGDFATQRTILTILKMGDSVDFTVPTSVRTVLGFNSEVLTAPAANYTFYSESTAAFNRNNSYIVASNLVSVGIPVNNQSSGIIASIPISVPPGSQIPYNPQNIIWWDASELIGNPKLNMTFRLLNQALASTPTSGDTWSITVIIRYGILMSTSVIPLKP